jgi:hypothetical protein
MKLMAAAGLWSTAAVSPPAPLVALLEVSGAVLSWTVDEPASADTPRITFTDPRRADWLWQVLGESGHVAVAAALDGRPAADGQPAVELPGVSLAEEPTERLRRLAMGHWLRRWWPASARDGIAGLDGALLDAEIAVLTAAAQDFFTDDTLDSEMVGLLTPHAVTLTTHVLAGDRRTVALVRQAVDLADELGVDGAGWAQLYAALDDSPQFAVSPPSRGQDDYALAAGVGQGSPGAGVITGGVASVQWSAVLPGIFDAAENTVDWVVQVVDSQVVVNVWVAAIGDASGVEVRLRSTGISGAGVLDADGRATFGLVDSRQQPISEVAAWDHHWPSTRVTVGGESQGAGESSEIRERIRRFALTRLQRQEAGAYLAEVVAAESDY